MTGLDLSPQLQAGLGRPAIYKKRPEVAAALGLRKVAFCITNGRVSCCERSPSVLQTERFHAAEGRLLHYKRKGFMLRKVAFCITNGKVSCCERSPSALQTEGFHTAEGRFFHYEGNNPVENIVGLPYSQRYNLRIWNVIIPVVYWNNIRLQMVGLPMSGETNSYFQHGDNRDFLQYLRSTILRHLRGTFFSVKTCWHRTYVTPSGFRFRLCLPFFL